MILSKIQSQSPYNRSSPVLPWVQKYLYLPKYEYISHIIFGFESMLLFRYPMKQAAAALC